MGADRSWLADEARRRGIPADQALLVADLSRHAAHQAFESIQVVADSVPDPRTRLAIRLSAIATLFRGMQATLAEMASTDPSVAALLAIWNQEPAPAETGAEPPSSSSPVPAGEPGQPRPQGATTSAAPDAGASDAEPTSNGDQAHA